MSALPLGAGGRRFGRVGVVAAQDVAERRSRQAFHLGEPVEDAVRSTAVTGGSIEVVDVMSTVTPNRSSL